MNIVCIIADQMNKYVMGCMGNPDVHTPHLDSLADEGVLFARAYSNNPVCSPFRIHLMTGLYSSDTETLSNNTAIPEWCTTLPELFGQSGFTTSYVGKWHVGGNGNEPIPERHRAGFDRFIGYQCYNGFKNNVWFYDEEGKIHKFDRHRTDVTADLAISRLEEIKDGPFIQYICFQAPHYPVQPSQEYYNLYKDVTITKTPDYVEGVEPYTPTFSPPSPRPFEMDEDYRRYGGDMDEYLRNYYAMVSQIDANVGRIISYLKDNGLWENTAVFFMSDHGDMQGSHGKVNKCLPWERSSGIPFIARVPGGKQGGISLEPVSGVDTFPTFLELAGIDNTVDQRGVSFAGLISSGPDSDDKSERVAFSEGMDGDWVMLCKGGYKLVADRKSRKPTMLYDLDNDPWEMENLISHKGVGWIRDSMMKRLLEILDSPPGMFSSPL